MRRILVCLLVVAGLATVAGAFGATEPQGQAFATSTLGEINALRTSHGVVPLTPSPGLSASASVHSREMVRVGYFGHKSPDGSPFWKRIERSYGTAGYTVWAVGENLAFASPSLDAETLLKMWLASPHHRENLLDPRWRQVGISAVHVERSPAIFGSTPATIVTADFGVRSPARHT